MLSSCRGCRRALERALRGALKELARGVREEVGDVDLFHRATRSRRRRSHTGRTRARVGPKGAVEEVREELVEQASAPTAEVAEWVIGSHIVKVPGCFAYTRGGRARQPRPSSATTARLALFRHRRSSRIAILRAASQSAPRVRFDRDAARVTIPLEGILTA
jgi:hypothetical protein